VIGKYFGMFVVLIELIGCSGYIVLIVFVINVVVVVVFMVVLWVFKVPVGVDEISFVDYKVDAGDLSVYDLLELVME